MGTKKLDSKKTAVPAYFVWGLLTSLSSIDQERNNISLFNVIDQITVPKQVFTEQKKLNKPILFPVEHELITLWKRVINVGLANAEILFDVKINITDPLGNNMPEISQQMVMQKNIRRSRFRIRMEGFLLTQPGDYVYEISIKKMEGSKFEKVAEIPFEVCSTK